jgi:ATP-dependent DNA helicase RecG
MQSENQNIEWKESWSDHYLEWICGFANAKGGKIYIGKNDQGHVVGVLNYQELLVLLPNKIRQSLGITPEINHQQYKNFDFIEIVIQPSSVAISLRGRYYFRSGSVKSELTGSSLNEFLLKKSGQTWDEVLVDGADFTHINPQAIDRFKEATLISGRLPNIESLTIEQLFDKLHLLKEGRIKRAGIAIFGKDPYQFFPSLKVKIGRFGKSGSEIRFHELIEGNLIHLFYETLQILDYKFLVRNISYHKAQRVETLEYPEEALKEVIWNALIHARFSGIPIQIKVFDDRITFWNDGSLPDEMTVAKLREVHKSIPRNPLIADVCFKAGFIESWGRGTLKIAEAAVNAGLPDPEFVQDSGGFEVVLFKKPRPIGDVKPAITGDKPAITGDKLLVVNLLKDKVKMKASEVALQLGLKSSRTRELLAEMVSENLLIAEGANKNRVYLLKKQNE